MHFFLLIVLSVLLAVVTIILRTKLIIIKRISASLFKGVTKERNAR